MLDLLLRTLADPSVVCCCLLLLPGWHHPVSSPRQSAVRHLRGPRPRQQRCEEVVCAGTGVLVERLSCLLLWMWTDLGGAKRGPERKIAEGD
jgi:hypothetical protein